MAILKTLSELEQVDGYYTQPNAPIWDTTANRYDPLWSRGCWNLNTQVGAYLPIAWPVSNEVWIHFVNFIFTSRYEGVYTPAISVGSSDNTHIAGFGTAVGSNLIGCHVNGTQLGSTGPRVVGTMVTVDINIKIDVAGHIKIYLNDTLSAEYIGDTTVAGKTPDRILLYNLAWNYGLSYMSQFIVADTNTLGSKLWTGYPNAAGTTQQFTGAYTDIDDPGILDNADFIYTNTIADKSTFNYSNMPIEADPYQIQTVQVISSVRNTVSSAINDVKTVVRSAGTDYESANMGIVKDGTVQTVVADYPNDPATGTAWSGRLAIDTAEFGVKTS